VPDYRILITGSRSWTDRDQIAFELGRAIGESGAEMRDIVLVHGACPSGADAMAAALAMACGYRQEAHPADWRPGGVLDRSAGFIRDGSRGATHCAGLAGKAGITTRRFTA
jgi:YspA, cpYpsA-related SLOG family